MQTGFNELLTVTFTLFAVIDIVGSIPLLLSLKKKMGGIQEVKATLISGGLMILFLYLGEPFLHVLGVETHSFAVAGSIVIFILGLEMILGIEFFKSDKEAKSYHGGTDCISADCRIRNTHHNYVPEGELQRKHAVDCHSDKPGDCICGVEIT